MKKILNLGLQIKWVNKYSFNTNFFLRSSFIVCTECTIEKCIECGRDFRTYVPNSVCKLPDGNYVTYADLQLLCPLCDPNQYGSFMNADLFPELSASWVAMYGTLYVYTFSWVFFNYNSYCWCSIITLNSYHSHNYNNVKW